MVKTTCSIAVLCRRRRIKKNLISDMKFSEDIFSGFTDKLRNTTYTDTTAMTDSQTTLIVSSTAGFPTTGTLLVGNEKVSYKNKTLNKDSTLSVIKISQWGVLFSMPISPLYIFYFIIIFIIFINYNYIIHVSM